MAQWLNPNDYISVEEFKKEITILESVLSNLQTQLDALKDDDTVFNEFQKEIDDLNKRITEDSWQIVYGELSVKNPPESILLNTTDVSIRLKDQKVYVIGANPINWSNTNDDTKIPTAKDIEKYALRIDVFESEKDNLFYFLQDKVDKEEGKQLSTHDFTDAHIQTIRDVQPQLDKKVDKAPGKGLTSNDFTTHYKNILDGWFEPINGWSLSGADLRTYAKLENIKLTAANVITFDTPTISRVNAVPIDWDNQKQNNYIPTVADIKAFPAIRPSSLVVYEDRWEAEAYKKVDKVTGKGLSSNDFTDLYLMEVNSFAWRLDTKVNKIFGKGLSTLDFTHEDAEKLDEYDPNHVAGWDYDIELGTISTFPSIVQINIQTNTSITFNSPVVELVNSTPIDWSDASQNNYLPTVGDIKNHNLWRESIYEGNKTVAINGTYDYLILNALKSVNLGVSGGGAHVTLTSDGVTTYGFSDIDWSNSYFDSWIPRVKDIKNYSKFVWQYNAETNELTPINKTSNIVAQVENEIILRTPTTSFEIDKGGVRIDAGKNLFISSTVSVAINSPNVIITNNTPIDWGNLTEEMRTRFVTVNDLINYSVPWHLNQTGCVSLVDTPQWLSLAATEVISLEIPTDTPSKMTYLRVSPMGLYTNAPRINWASNMANQYIPTVRDVKDMAALWDVRREGRLGTTMTTIDIVNALELRAEDKVEILVGSGDNSSIKLHKESINITSLGGMASISIDDIGIELMAGGYGGARLFLGKRNGLYMLQLKNSHQIDWANPLYGDSIPTVKEIRQYYSRNKTALNNLLDYAPDEVVIGDLGTYITMPPKSDQDTEDIRKLYEICFYFQTISKTEVVGRTFAIDLRGKIDTVTDSYVSILNGENMEWYMNSYSTPTTGDAAFNPILRYNESTKYYEFDFQFKTKSGSSFNWYPVKGFIRIIFSYA